MKTIPFTKMQGAGNDFVFIDRARAGVSLTPALVRKLMDRHFGVGGDQLLYLDKKGNNGDISLKIYNSDGSQAEMCGNGVRAVAFYLTRFKGVKKKFTIQTKAGPIGIGLKGSVIEVDMGRPILEGSRIPVKAKGEIFNRPLKVGGKTYKIHAVSMGNPHCVIYVNDVNNFPVATVGPMIENHPFFPRRVNVEFVQVLSKNHVRARVWERGAGETLACGTGACAVAVAGARAKKTGSNVKIDLPGGQLSVRLAENGHVFLGGPAEVSYNGHFII